MPPSLLRSASIALALLVGCEPSTADHADSPRAPAATPYAAVADGAGLLARNDAQAFVARFDGRTVDLAPTHPGADWTFSLGAVAFGCEGDARAVAPPSAPLRAAGSRIDVPRADASGRSDVSEWYVNTASGLAQGFTLAARPAACGGASVVVAMNVAGSLRGALEGDSVVFADARGARVLGYGALRVCDPTAASRSTPAATRARTSARTRASTRARVSIPGLMPAWVSIPGLMPAWVSTRARTWVRIARPIRAWPRTRARRATRRPRATSPRGTWPRTHRRPMARRWQRARAAAAAA